MKANHRHLVTAALALCVFAPSGIAVAVEKNHSGTYENVRFVAEADDYVGAWIKVSDRRPTSVAFQLCEGSCLGAETFPAKIEGNSLSFVYLARWNEPDGRQTIERIPVSGRFVKRGLMLRVGNAAAELLLRKKERSSSSATSPSH